MLEIHQVEQIHREIFEASLSGIDVSKMNRYKKYLAKSNDILEDNEEGELDREKEHFTDVLNILNHGK